MSGGNPSFVIPSRSPAEMDIAIGRGDTSSNSSPD